MVYTQMKPALIFPTLYCCLKGKYIYIYFHQVQIGEKQDLILLLVTTAVAKLNAFSDKDVLLRVGVLLRVLIGVFNFQLFNLYKGRVVESSALPLRRNSTVLPHFSILHQTDLVSHSHVIVDRGVFVLQGLSTYLAAIGRGRRLSELVGEIASLQEAVHFFQVSPQRTS